MIDFQEIEEILEQKQLIYIEKQDSNLNLEAEKSIWMPNNEKLKK